MLTALRRAGLRFAKEQAFVRANLLRAGSLLRRLESAPNGVYSLCYHHVARTACRGLSAQIALLKRYGTFIDVDAAVARITSGQAGSDRSFVLTFDDGYADAVDVALPVLRDHRVPAILFLVSDWLDKPPARASRAAGYVTHADVETWLGSGLAIGSHSASHRRFIGLSREEAEVQLTRSAEALGRFAGQPIRDFACPWGVANDDYDPLRDPALAHKLGYRTFFTTRRGHALGETDLLSMPRHVLEPEWDLSQLKTLLGGPRFGRG